MNDFHRTKCGKEREKIKKDLENGYTQDFKEQEINIFDAYLPTDYEKTLVPTQPGRNKLRISVKMEKGVLIQEKF